MASALAGGAAGVEAALLAGHVRGGPVGADPQAVDVLRVGAQAVEHDLDRGSRREAYGRRGPRVGARLRPPLDVGVDGLVRQGPHRHRVVAGPAEDLAGQQGQRGGVEEGRPWEGQRAGRQQAEQGRPGAAHGRTVKLYATERLVPASRPGSLTLT